MNITYEERKFAFIPAITHVLLDGKVVGQFTLLSKGWKFMWLGDTWSRCSATSMAEIQLAIRDKKTMLDITTKLTR